MMQDETMRGRAHPADVQAATAQPAAPPEAPLAMPTQSFQRWSAAQGRKGGGSFGLDVSTIVARIAVFGGGLALTAYGIAEMYGVVSVSGGVTFLQWLLLILFALNFSWISIAFASGVVGFVWLLLHKRRPAEMPALSRTTAVVMPIYNEDTSRCFGSLQAIIESTLATGRGGAFEFFVLSDTTQPDIWIAEERAFLDLRRRLPADVTVFYRRRPKNTARKAGNIADFVTRWGGRYPFMIVLDADSLMTGECLVRLAAAMEADPDSGVIQTLPLIINRNTLFARLQQFAARVYGPVIAAGLTAWMGKDGNYWGHNAIIRMEAFAQCGGMPELPGKPPFGGHILSHDFVEAALIRRAGWTVTMLPLLPGSYEESPPSLIDLAARDRRWCQGNLQHVGVIGAKGFRLATRQHFATGIMSYLASPLWLMQLVVGLLLVLQTKYAKPEYFTQDFALHPAWPRFDPERALSLFVLTLSVLLAPKALGLIVSLLDGRQRRGHGGGIRLMASSLIEVIGSALLAPVLMLIQSGSVFQIVAGRDTGWNPQRRGDGSIPFRDIVRRHRAHTLLGIGAGAAAYGLSPYLFAWMSPTIVGLVLSIPLSGGSGLLSLGLALKRAGLLLTPEETATPPIVLRANALHAELAESGFDGVDGLVALHADPELLARHVAMLPTAQRRVRGVIDPDRAVAEAKITDAASLDDATAWLKPRERMVVMSDRALLAIFAALPRTPVAERIHAAAE